MIDSYRTCKSCGRPLDNEQLVKDLRSEIERQRRLARQVDIVAGDLSRRNYIEGEQLRELSQTLANIAKQSEAS